MLIAIILVIPVVALLAKYFFELEELINYTNEYYREKKLAVVQKIPTPIKPIRMDKDSSQITLAYFEKDSTVDYIGVVQGIPICFDAKECAVVLQKQLL